MKGTLSMLVLAAAAALVAASECPADWTQELLLPHEDCNKFYKCTYGVPVEQNCWGHLHFNIETWQCDWPENVDCGDRNVPGVAPETEEEPAPESVESIEPAPVSVESIEPAPESVESVEPAPESVESIEPSPEGSIEFRENGCPVDPHVHWLLPHESNCNLYYNCVWGGKQLRRCAGTLHFNRVLQVCDWPSDAGCITSANLHLSGRKAYRGL